ncbi:serine/threonine-protein kinase PBS1 [Vigna unguiculata]|uniref:Serine/threonine-protein kinase PBS1 n=2 Tax=Vigna unguiculata TaxID=3917 RepID=A0A4D6M5N7_VIGUN|nr:serine/threonine-protein kinase PBS1 [Vigna unguiculata]
MSNPHTQVNQEKQYHEAHQRAAKSVCSVCHNRRPPFEMNRKKEFSYAELCAATQGFSPKNYLSEGGFGSVFKGELCGEKIAVKQHTYANQKGEKEFKSEVDVLSKAMHENVVMLLGSCAEGIHRLLVYEYVCNASLDQHLSQHSRKLLDWQDRVKVADGAAKGLLYLHENNIIHRDLTTNNILLTHDYEALLGDFGLARTVIEGSSYSTECVGNLAYMAPEYAESGKVSIKTDVYSFGVVLLQLITGMRTTDKRLGGKGLVEWARPLLREGKCQDLIDGRMMNSHDCHQLYWMSRLAGNCLQRDPQKRLHMNTVVKALSQIGKGCSCIVRKDHTLLISGPSRSKDDSEESSQSQEWK